MQKVGIEEYYTVCITVARQIWPWSGMEAPQLKGAIYVAYILTVFERLGDFSFIYRTCRLCGRCYAD